MLMILDGFGINHAKDEKNAIEGANPVNFRELWNAYPHAELEASGEAVGLPEGQMGNSEVGHLNIGAGRVVYQPLTEITKDIRDGAFFEIPVLKEAFALAKEKNRKLHLAGLVSDGGVHSSLDHLYGLLEMARRYGLKNVWLHAFMDGRDTPPESGAGYLAEVAGKMSALGVGAVATISGRYYAMDRDKNWDRVKIAYDCLVLGLGHKAPSAAQCMAESYAAHVTDEFVLPTVIDPAGLVEKDDVFINFNFRPDRAREITRALNDRDFEGFPRTYLGLHYYCMRQYDATIEAPVIYHDREIKNTLGEVLSKAGLRQLRTAETEKYAHVTFFFNGGVEVPNPGEDRKLVASPKVATYDLKPEMSAYEVTAGVLEAIRSDVYDVIILNFANPDMVGHTGIYEAAVAAIKAVDACIGKIADAILSKGAGLLIIADHGNSEKMYDPAAKEPWTAHTTNKVPCILVAGEYRGASLKDGKLSDVAPTMLKLLGIAIPPEMTGTVLIK
jgi:2,3-bisphosphoglycerate-independent phosphoglycerate mutase